MGRVSELVSEYTALIHPCRSTEYAVYARETSEIFQSFRAAIGGLEDIEDEIVQGLSGLRFNREWRDVMLWLIAADECATSPLVRPLCDLLDIRDEYVQHEWIAETLGEIGSPDAIDSLSKACEFDLPNDVFRSLSKKCLDSLMKIGTPDAIAEIRSHLSSPWIAVSEYAKELLDEAT
jgi:HEAT repeat protein